MWLGLDDTDSLDGGCTTLVFHELLDALPCEYGEPRLTRLWPFAARRTRGNAALSVEIFADENIISSPINSSDSNTCSLNINETDALTFGNAFKYYRSCLNQNENFSWRGKAYTTNLNIEKEIHLADSLKERKSDQEISEID